MFSSQHKTLCGKLENNACSANVYKHFARVHPREQTLTQIQLLKYINAEWGSQTLKQACYRENPESAMCVQNLNDSRGLAIRITYRISLRSSSLWEPRHPPLKVVLDYVFEGPDTRSRRHSLLQISIIKTGQFGKTEYHYHYCQSRQQQYPECLLEQHGCLTRKQPTFHNKEDLGSVW